MTEELDDLRGLARAFAEKEIKPNVERFIANKQVDRELWTKAGEIGLLCLSIPEEYGGSGGTFAHEAVLIEEQGRVGDSSWGASLHSGIVAHYLLAYGTEAQKREWLPKLASGESVAAIAMTEPGTGSDLQGIATKAIRDGDEYVVNGAKTFITNGYQADVVLVAAKTDPEEAASGISLVIVPTDTSGFKRGRVLDKIGMKGQDTCELFFDDCRVPASNLLGEKEGEGFIQLMTQLPQERLIVGVACVAAMEFVLEETLQYVHSREAFGRPIFKFQNTKFELAEIATEARVARSFLDECIELHVKGELDIPTAAMVKYWCSERAMKVADQCLQLFGGYGYMEEYPVARVFTDMRVQQIYAGTTEIMKEIISRSLPTPS
ncbi:acyl-CoA dehydrogenase family protein [Saccharopolyspora mangrovi]|uniref:Acyl-CoA dehydrogenase family protein n=1 Tax=Saccharopolyspora mangrovi TaxID=3082379 RepID=A0ABU6A7V7_9PSEU|nr:acyl-CoA dehydrogenase family protein [Saccharopolyspora sp. S2-29]MEB3367469.1 acyl-CoA dehydrogenase family protein [Saccharopolyspora sp. S2-29]